MWLVHFPLNNILIFIFPLFLFLFSLHETDTDLQTTDLKRKPGPSTYKGPGSPWSHFPSGVFFCFFFFKGIFFNSVLSSLFIIHCQTNNLNTVLAFLLKSVLLINPSKFYQSQFTGQQCNFCEHCGFWDSSSCLWWKLTEKSG